MSADQMQVSALWIGDSLGPYELLSISSFITKGFHFDLYSYNPDLQVPKSVRLCDANVIVNRAEVFENRHEPGTFGGFSNIFRYQLLKKSETTWVDLDLVMLTADLPHTEYLLGYEEPGIVNGALLRLPKNSVILDEALIRARATKISDVRVGVLGPRLLTELVNTHGLQDQVSAISDFYPINWKDAWLLFDPERLSRVEEMTAKSVAIHLWNEAIRRTGLKDKRPPKGSYLERLFTTYGIELDGWPHTSGPEARRLWRNEIQPDPGPVILFRRRAKRLPAKIKRRLAQSRRKSK